MLSKKNDEILIDLLLTSSRLYPNQVITCSDRSTTTPFFEAVKRNHINAIRLFLRRDNPDQIVTKADGSTTTPLYQAIQDGNEEVVALLVKGGANSNLETIPSYHNSTTPLNEAFKRGNKKIITLLLTAGANPNQELIERGVRTTVFHKLITQKNIDSSVLTRFFEHSRFKLDVSGETLIPLLIKATPELSQTQRKEISHTIAKGIPVPFTGLRLATKYVSEDLRKALVEYVIRPVFDSHPLITPLARFLEKTTRDNEKFHIFLDKMHEYRAMVGSYHYDTKNISIYFSIDEKNSDISQAIDKIKGLTNHYVGTLIHETMHMVVDKLGWHSNPIIMNAIKTNVEKDLTTLNLLHSDAIIADHIRDIHSQYLNSEHAEEYLVRIPEMLIQMQQQKNCSYDEAIRILKAHLPHLFEIYEKQLLPKLIKFNG